MLIALLLNIHFYIIPLIKCNDVRIKDILNGKNTLKIMNLIHFLHFQRKIQNMAIYRIKSCEGKKMSPKEFYEYHDEICGSCL
jgi:hypothetical protein